MWYRQPGTKGFQSRHASLARLPPVVERTRNKIIGDWRDSLPSHLNRTCVGTPARLALSSKNGRPEVRFPGSNTETSSRNLSATTPNLRVPMLPDGDCVNFSTRSQTFSDRGTKP
jgi:hypothetical protein